MSQDKNGSRSGGSSLESSKAAFQKALQHQKSGDLAAAVDGYDRVLRIDPSAPDALNNLGVALRGLGQREAAAVAYQRLLALHPPKAETLINLGNVLRELGRFDKGEAAFLKALELKPDARGALYGLGLVYRDWNRLEESLSYLEKALTQQPEDPDLNWDRAQTLLRMGDYKRGLEAYEWRWKLSRSASRKFNKPKWDGSSLRGKTLLLFGEQGFGDAIQFARFIPVLSRQYETEVLLEVRPELVRLLEGQLPGVKQIIPRGTELPEYDFHLPLLSVPHILKTDMSDVPSEPYLKPKEGLVGIPAAEPGSINVGLTWAGSPTQANDRNRTFKLEDMLPLLQLPQCKFFSLQKGDATKELDQLGVKHAITPIGSALRDFADTSAVMHNLDLLITADTSVAHLAGAMGKPVWIALSVFHDWRYDATGSIKAWYPNAEVFRQKTPGDWGEVFQRIAGQLKAFSAT